MTGRNAVSGAHLQSIVVARGIRRYERPVESPACACCGTGRAQASQNSSFSMSPHVSISPWKQRLRDERDERDILNPFSANIHHQAALDASRARMAQYRIRAPLAQQRAFMGVYGSRWVSQSSKLLHGRLRVHGWVRLPYAPASWSPPSVADTTCRLRLTAPHLAHTAMAGGESLD